jgi:hypothetical protein
VVEKVVVYCKFAQNFRISAQISFKKALTQPKSLGKPQKSRESTGSPKSPEVYAGISRWKR